MDLLLFYRFLSVIGLYPKEISNNRNGNGNGGKTAFEIACDYFKWTYFGWNGLIICFPVVVTLISLFYRLDPRQASLFFFYLIPVVHYYLAWRYYRSPHLNHLCTDCRRQGIKLPDKWMVICALNGLCILLVMMRIIFWYTLDQKPGILLAIEGLVPTSVTPLTDHQIGWISFFIIYYWMVSWTLMLSNLLIFSLTFWKHSKDLKDLKDHLEEYLIWKTRELDMAALLRRIAELRTLIGESINLLESFYTSFTLLGAVALGPMIESKILDAHMFFYLVVYFLVQMLFWYFIYSISSLRSDLRLLVQSPHIVSRCLNRARCRQQLYTNTNTNTASDGDVEMKGLGGEDNQNHNNQNNHKLIEVNQQTIMADLDWIMLHDLLSESWAEFSLMGVSFGSTDVIQKAMGLTSLVILGATYLGTTILTDPDAPDYLQATMEPAPLFSPEELLEYLEENLRQRLTPAPTPSTPMPTSMPTMGPTNTPTPAPTTYNDFQKNQEISYAVARCINQYLL